MLVATDLSARSDRAVERACLLAHQRKEKLTMLYAIENKLPEELRDHAREWATNNLTKLAKAHSGQGLQIEIRVEVGQPDEVIAQLAIDHDLLVLGLHDQNDGNRFPHSTAGKIISQSVNTILLVREPSDKPYSSVVVGIDLSIYSLPAIVQAHSYAPDATLHLVHAYHTPFSGIGFGLTGDEYRNEVVKRFSDFVASELNNSNKRAKKLGLTKANTTTHLIEGDPTHVLYQRQERERAELLVLATHGKPSLGRALFGSVAETLLHKPPCDLLVIRPF